MARRRAERNRRRPHATAALEPSRGPLSPARSVSMGAMGTFDLAGEVGDRDELLGAGRQVAQADLARRELVAEDDREVGAVASRGLELLAELAPAELGAGRDPRRAQLRGDPQARRRCRPGRRRRRPTGRRRRRSRRRPVSARPGSAGRARSRTRSRASAARRAARRARRSGRRRRSPAAGPRARRRRTRTRSACSSRGRGRARARAGTARRGRRGAPARRRSARRTASHSRSVIFGAAALSAAIAGSFESSRRRTLRSSRSRSSRRQRVAVGAVVGGQLGDVGRPAGRIADRVEVDLDPGQPGVAVEPRAELDDLGVDRRARVADRLDVELPELAVAARLRPVVAEHRPGLGQLDRLRPGLHPVLDVGADDPGGRLGPERPATRTPRSAARAGRAPSRRCR